VSRVPHRDVPAVPRGGAEADLISDEEECILRDHLLAFHPNMMPPETLGVLLRHFVITTNPAPVA